MMTEQEVNKNIKRQCSVTVLTPPSQCDQSGGHSPQYDGGSQSSLHA